MSCSFHRETWPSAKLMLIAPGTGCPCTAFPGFAGWRAMLQRPKGVETLPLERSLYSLSVIFGHVSGQIASKNVGVSVGRLRLDSWPKITDKLYSDLSKGSVSTPFGR